MLLSTRWNMPFTGFWNNVDILDLSTRMDKSVLQKIRQGIQDILTPQKEQEEEAEVKRTGTSNRKSTSYTKKQSAQVRVRTVMGVQEEQLAETEDNEKQRSQDILKEATEKLIKNPLPKGTVQDRIKLWEKEREPHDPAEAERHRAGHLRRGHSAGLWRVRGLRPDHLPQRHVRRPGHARGHHRIEPDRGAYLRRLEIGQRDAGVLARSVTSWRLAFIPPTAKFSRATCASLAPIALQRPRCVPMESRPPRMP